MLSDPSSDGPNSASWARWEELASDGARQITAYDYWGDGSLLSPELNAYVSPCISSSPAGLPPRIDAWKTDPIQFDQSSEVPIRLQPQIKKPKDTNEKRRPNFSHPVKERLLEWLRQHKDHPYPAAAEVAQLAVVNGLTVKQVRTFFVNNRIRLLRNGHKVE
jgi:hypothetical protein